MKNCICRSQSSRCYGRRPGNAVCVGAAEFTVAARIACRRGGNRIIMIYGIPGFPAALLPILALLVYVPYDLWRNRSRSWVQRLLVYSLFVYLAYVLEYTLGTLGRPLGSSNPG